MMMSPLVTKQRIEAIVLLDHRVVIPKVQLFSGSMQFYPLKLKEVLIQQR
jgi:hypothetical protein